MKGWLLAAATAVMLSACAGRRPPIPASDARDLLARLTEVGSRPTLFDGEVRLSGRHRGQRLRARVLAVVEPGGRFYIETVEGPPFVVACDGEEIRVVLGDAREWLRAETTLASMEALFGLPLEPDELGALLGGSFLPPRRLSQAAFDHGHLGFPGGRLDLDPLGRWPVGGTNRGLRFRLSAPDRLELEVPAERLRLDLVLRRAGDPLAPRPPGLFHPEPPAGFREVPLEGGRRPLLLPSGEPG